MRIFEYAVFFVPTSEQIKNGMKPEIIKQAAMLAENDKTITLKVGKELDNKWDDLLDQIQIAVRPF